MIIQLGSKCHSLSIAAEMWGQRDIYQGRSGLIIERTG